MRLLLCGLVMGLVGCQHAHLRHNTVHQAQTLAEIYEQQVLDNLAKTVHDAHALPYFAYPEDGTSRITDTASIAATPFSNFTNVFGINGTRAGLEQWGLIPVADPDKLQLMQCAYQRAIYGQPLSDCVKCCALEKTFEGKPDKKKKVFNPKEVDKKSTKEERKKSADGTELEPAIGAAIPLPHEETQIGQLDAKAMGTPATDKETGLPYNGQWIGDKWEYQHTDGKYYPVDEEGYATVPTLDCDGPCAITCGWIGYGSKCDVPKDCCQLTGFHCGTYVWVPKCHRGKLSQLTLKILDYAVNDPKEVAKRTKEVTIFVDEFGRQTSEDEKHVGSVTARIAVDDLVSSVAVIDKPGLEKDKARREQLEEDLKNAGVPDDQLIDLDSLLFGPQLYTLDAEAFESIDIENSVSKDNQPAVKKVILDYLKETTPLITPSTPSLIERPKQRTRRGDGYEDIYETQRRLDAIGN